MLLKSFNIAVMAAILDIGTERLAILNLHVTLMPPIKFRLNLTYCLGEAVIWRFFKMAAILDIGAERF